MTATSYDLVAYPATIFSVTHPSRLAAIARLHGLDAPAVETARVLEIGGGDGVNVIAMAAAYPRAQFHNFDLSAVAIARGDALIHAAGLTNIVNRVGDITVAADTLEGPFDYIIAHGVYAWVPPPVRAALMRLVGRVLAPDGVAFISYNALPGGHLRQVIRDLMFHHLQGIDDPAARLQRAYEVLEDFARPRSDERAIVAAMREVARPMLRHHPETLFHDELSGEWHPQLFSDVIAAANAEGLAFLNDAAPVLIFDGLPGNDDNDAAVVRLAQTTDFGSLAFFHQTLLVRDGRRPARRLDPESLAPLFVSSQAVRIGADRFRIKEDEFTVGDAVLADRLAALSARWPQRLPVSAVADTPDMLEAMFRLYTAEVVGLYATPLPGVTTAGARPQASPVVRAQIAAGHRNLFSLDHNVVAMPVDGPLAFLALLDGSRDRDQLAADWAASGHGHEIDVEAALQQMAAAGFLVA
ncbi:methyltransferase [Sandarakinorhabdus sp. DWP1-3-1]|uniref:methyltransferase n=1 Tax=Sandarakinorhabdus sp. DWP1-3-1 TaxID=2804627 RepID=UPI003CED3BA9